MRTRIVGALGVLLLSACSSGGSGESVGSVSQALHNANVNVSNMAGPQSEVGIAVNPANPQNVVTISHDISNLRHLGVWYSNDGGGTWTPSFVDGLVDDFPTTDSRFDPNVAFDSDGRLYVVYSMNGSGNRVVVLRSSDGGQTYDQRAVVTTDAGANNLHTPMVTTRTDASGNDDVLVVWARVQGGVESIEASLSIDAGATFPTTNTQINDSLQRTFVPWAVAHADGDFSVVWEVNQSAGTGAIFHDRLDGVTLAGGADTTVSTVQITDFAAATSKIPAQPDRGIFSVATVDVDRSTGRTYVSYADRANNTTDDTDVFVRISDDGGTSWSAATRLNDDATTTSQFMPRLAVDATDGTVYAIWYDARHDVTNNALVDIYSTISVDGGTTWSPNHRLTDAVSDESVGNPLRYTGNYLEYIGLSASSGAAHVAWTDARSANFTAGTNEDIYTTRFSAEGPVCSGGTYEAETMFHSTGNAAPPDGWNLHSNGYISTTHDFTAGPATITVRALGQSAGGVAPHMIVRVGGTVVGQVNVGQTTYTDFPFTFSASAGLQEIRIEFDNDFYQPPQDRNLWLDRLTVECASEVPENPCAGLCEAPTSASWTSGGSYQSGNLGTAAVCREVTQPVVGGNCGNFAAGRQLLVNGVPMVCNGANWASVPATRNGGYCVQATPGNWAWAFVTLW